MAATPFASRTPAGPELPGFDTVPAGLEEEPDLPPIGMGAADDEEDEEGEGGTGWAGDRTGPSKGLAAVPLPAST